MSHPVAQFQCPAQRVAPQIEVTVLCTQILSAIGIVLYCKRRRNRAVENLYGRKFYLYLSGWNLAVLALALRHNTGGLYYIFPSQL